MTVIAIEPRGADLGAVTAETRRAAELAAIGGYVAQVWTWRGGEAVVVREWSSLRGYERWAVLVRRGLRRGVPQRLHVGSIAAALAVLGIAYRIKSLRRRPTAPDPRAQPGSAAASAGEVLTVTSQAWTCRRTPPLPP